MANILYRLGVVDILECAQYVCTDWREICKDPAMWRVVHIDTSSDLSYLQFDKMFEDVVDRSQGQLVDITIVESPYYNILPYLADRSSQLKRLTMACCDLDCMVGSWTEALKKFPLLEELSLYETEMSIEGIEIVGCYCSTLKNCSMLKTLKVNLEYYRFWDSYSDWEIDSESMKNDCTAIAIRENLHELKHLELIGNPMSKKGLEMILDGCHRLESLDLRGCLFIDLDGDLGKRCLQQIKCVKLPDDSLKGCPYIYQDVANESARGSDDDCVRGSYEESEGRSESDKGSDKESDD